MKIIHFADLHLGVESYGRIDPATGLSTRRTVSPFQRTTSIGGSPRVILAFDSKKGGHAYAEVYVASSKQGLQNIANYIFKRYGCSSIAYHTSYSSSGEPRYWLNLDWSARHPGGSLFDSDGEMWIVYPDGYYEEYG